MFDATYLSSALVCRPGKSIAGVVILALSLAACGGSATGAEREKISPQVYERTAFLGDSITDGNTYPCLVRDALIDGSLPPMTVINAGIGGDTAAAMRKRLQRDVLAFHPTLVTLSCGANDCLRDVSPADYEQDVREIARQLKDAGIPLILLTPNILGPKQERGKKNLLAYEASLRKVAAEFGLRIAEVNRCQNADLAAGHVELAADDLHPNYQGQRMIARALLDAMGYANLKVPDRVRNQPFEGIVSPWRIKPVDPKELPLSEQRVAKLSPDGTWLDLNLPQKQRLPDWDSPDNAWLDDYRTLGVSVGLRKLLPKERAFIGMATIHSDRPRIVQFHTGAELNAIWLNGRQIYRNDGLRGWHPGRESVTAELRAGDNRVVAEMGPVFFLSMTDGPMW